MERHTAFFIIKFSYITNKDIALLKNIKLSAYDQERVYHINFKMNSIYGYADDIYEMLVDREFDSLKDVIEELMIELKDIQISITDEI
jgi:hypothetical protein